MSARQIDEWTSTARPPPPPTRPDVDEAEAEERRAGPVLLRREVPGRRRSSALEGLEHRRVLRLGLVHVHLHRRAPVVLPRTLTLVLAVLHGGLILRVHGGRRHRIPPPRRWQSIQDDAIAADAWDGDEYPLRLTALHERFAALVDRRASHTDQCASCSRARATAARVETVAHAAAFGLLALAALATDGRGVLVVAAAVAYGAHAGARALLPAFDDGALVPPRNLG